MVKVNGTGISEGIDLPPFRQQTGNQKTLLQKLQTGIETISFFKKLNLESVTDLCDVGAKKNGDVRSLYSQVCVFFVTEIPAKTTGKNTFRNINETT